MEKKLNESMIEIVYDNIIFSLQQSGGISGVWKELVLRINSNNNFICKFLEYDKASKNINRPDLSLSNKSLLDVRNLPLFLERFLNPTFNSNRKFIFHSSYYRICKDKNALNVTTVHDFIHEKFRSGFALYINHFQKKIALKKSDAIICISESTKQDLLYYFPELKDKNIFVVYNGVDSQVFKKLTIDKPDFIKNLNKYILYVGNRDQKYKNFKSLVEALKSHNDITLVLIGGGKLSTKELNFLNTELNGNFSYLKNIDNIKLNILYNFAYALVYPSLYEGFGMPVIEAQSAGCPVIATSTSSIVEIVNTSAIITNGTSIEISNSITLLKNPEFRDAFILKGLKNSQKYAWDKMAFQFDNIYRSIYNK
jgi:glycosyltransferase involved in cell wall biosynthesis